MRRDARASAAGPGRETAAERAQRLLERTILGGEFRPGDRLPSERAMAERIGTSRNVLREAMKKLETLGLISTEAQSGSYVRDYSSEASFDLVIHLMRNREPADPAAFRSVFECREMLETAAARLAARRDAKATADELLALSARVEAASDDPAQAAAVDFLFHSRLVGGSGNILFLSLHNTSREVHLFYTERYFRRPGALAETIVRQRAIAGAIGTGDPDASELAVSAMLSSGREAMERLLKIPSTPSIRPASPRSPSRRPK